MNMPVFVATNTCSACFTIHRSISDSRDCDDGNAKTGSGLRKYTRFYFLFKLHFC